MSRVRRNRRGFTLIELVIAVAIVGILGAIAIPSYLNYAERTRMKQVMIDISGISLKIDERRTEFGNLPGSLADVMSPVPLDPWGNPYKYLNLQSGDPGISGQRRRDKNLNPINSDYDLYSAGPDGKSKAQLTASDSRDDIVRGRDGEFIGIATDF